MEPGASELVAQLGSAEWRRRELAHHQLLEMGTAAISALAEGARYAEWRVRATSVALMDHLADERCIDVLCEAVRDDSLHVRRHAAHTLACQGCKPTPLRLDVLGMLLELATKDPSKYLLQWIPCDQFGDFSDRMAPDWSPARG